MENEFLSIIMPSYRLASSIAANVRRVDAVLAPLGIRYEIIVVDDGSGDGTDSVLSELANDDSFAGRAHLVPVILTVNGGKGNALKAGLKASKGSYILLLDADLDLAPEMLPNFFNIMKRENADIVIGSKRHPDSDIDYPFSRRLASSVYYGIVRLLTGLPVTDTQTGMKLFKREAIEWAFDRMLVKRFAFDVELLSIAHSAGYKVVEAPIKMEFGSKRGALTSANVKTVIIDTLAIFYRLRVIRYYDHVELTSISDPPPSVSIVIACPEHSAYLEEAIEGIKRQSFLPIEVIVLPDNDFEKPLVWPDYVRVVPTGKVRPAEKRNLGIETARGDIVAFLDDDASPQPQWLSQAVRHFSRHEVGAVGGPAITPIKEPRMAVLGGDVYASPFVSGNCRYRYVSERYREVDDLPSCNLLVRKDVLKEIGGYNTRYWPGEDTILCLDIVKKGFKIVYDPFAVVFHHRRKLFAPHLRQIGRYAMHRGFFARVFPQTSLRISYMIPSLFVLGIVLGIPAILYFPILAPIYYGILAFYGVVTFITSFHRNPIDWLSVWLGVVLTHLWYGIRFMQGLLFGRMPKEVRDFDHGGEK